ncbi:MAG: prepilin-type N-terminal cleavage/methylation domain-containing protein [Planctomycetota bacterium]
MKSTGFTLLELMIASSILFVVVGIALMFSMSATQETRSNTINARTEQNIVRLMETMQMDLSQSAPHYWGNAENPPGELVRTDSATRWNPIFAGDDISVAANTSAAFIQFRKIVPPTFYPGPEFSVVWSDPIRYELRLADHELTNGIDDNGNGMVDECVLVRIDTVIGDAVPVAPDLYFGTTNSISFGRDATIPLITITLHFFTEEGSAAGVDNNANDIPDYIETRQILTRTFQVNLGGM